MNRDTSGKPELKLKLNTKPIERSPRYSEGMGRIADLNEGAPPPPVKKENLLQSTGPTGRPLTRVTPFERGKPGTDTYVDGRVMPPPEEKKLKPALHKMWEKTSATSAPPPADHKNLPATKAPTP